MSYYPLEKELSEVLVLAAYLMAMMSLPAFAAVPAKDLFFEAVGSKHRHEWWWKIFTTLWGFGVIASVLFTVFVFIIAVLQKKFGAQENHIHLFVKSLFPVAMWLTEGFVALVLTAATYGVFFHFYYLFMRVVARRRIAKAVSNDPMFTQQAAQQDRIYKVGEISQRSGHYLCFVKGGERRVMRVVYVTEGTTFEGEKDEWFVFDREGAKE